MEHMKNCAFIFVYKKSNLKITDNNKDDVFGQMPSKCHLFLMPEKGNEFKVEG